MGHGGPAGADDNFPLAGWRDSPNPLASPHAVAGGEINVYAGQYPKSFNYYLDNNSFSADLFGALYETLLNMHPVTLQYEPGLAARWSIGADKRTFTFHLNPAAKWSDGRPVTAGDVKWTFDMIMSPTNMTGPHKVALAAFESPEIIDEHAIRFRAREVHWRNLGAAGGFQVAYARTNGNGLSKLF